MPLDNKEVKNCTTEAINKLAKIINDVAYVKAKLIGEPANHADGLDELFLLLGKHALNQKSNVIEIGLTLGALYIVEHTDEILAEAAKLRGAPSGPVTQDKGDSFPG